MVGGTAAAVGIGVAVAATVGSGVGVAVGKGVGVAVAAGTGVVSAAIGVSAGVGAAVSDSGDLEHEQMATKQVAVRIAFINAFLCWNLSNLEARRKIIKRKSAMNPRQSISDLPNS